MRPQWGDDRQPTRPSPTRTPALRPGPRRLRRTPRHRDPRLHRIDRHPGHRRGAAQPRPLPGRRAVRRGRPGRAARRAGPPAAACGRSRVADADGRAARCARRSPAATAPASRCPRSWPGPDAATELAALPSATPCSTASPAPSACAPTLAALEAGRVLVLANKESLIVGGPLVKAVARPGQIVPVDSEHSALFQALRGRHPRARSASWSSPPPAARSAAGRGRELAEVTPADGAGAPHLGHGPGGHHQLRDPGQQGPGGHRGAPALRHPLRADRGRGPPAVVRPLDGGVHRRLDAGPGQPARHAGADRARPRLAATGCRTPRPPSTGRKASTLGRSSRSTTRRSPPSRSPAQVGSARRHRTGGVQRGQRGVRRTPSWPAGCRSPGSWTPWPRWSRNTAPPPGTSLTVADVLEAEAWARARARETGAARRQRRHAYDDPDDGPRHRRLRRRACCSPSPGTSWATSRRPSCSASACPQYMVGFGPTIWSRTKGDTEYGVKAIPLGGYIRMIGMFPPGDDGRITARSTSPWRSMIEDARSAAFEELQPGRRGPAVLHAQALEARHRDVRRAVHEPDPGRRALPRRADGLRHPDPDRPRSAASRDCVISQADGQREQDTCAGDATRPPRRRRPDSRPATRIVAFNGTPGRRLGPRCRRTSATPRARRPSPCERDGTRAWSCTPNLIKNKVAKTDGNGGYVDGPVRDRRLPRLHRPPSGIVPLSFGAVRRPDGRHGRARRAASLVDLPGQGPRRCGTRPSTARRAQQDSPIGVVGAARVGGEVVLAGHARRSSGSPSC